MSAENILRKSLRSTRLAASTIFLSTAAAYLLVMVADLAFNNELTGDYIGLIAATLAGLYLLSMVLSAVFISANEVSA